MPTARSLPSPLVAAALGIIGLCGAARPTQAAAPLTQEPFPGFLAIDSITIEEIEAIRLRLEKTFDNGDLSGTDEAAAFLDLVNERRDLPPWYREEIRVLAEGYARMATLTAAERDELVSLLAADIDPRKDPARVRQIFEDAIVRFGESLPTGHPSTLRRMYYRSSLALQEDRWDDALRHALEATAAASASDRPEGPEVAACRMWTGWVYLRLNRLEEAEAELVAAQQLMEELGAPDLGVYEETWMHLMNYRGVHAMDTGRLEEAERLFRRHARLAKSHFGPTSQTYLSALNNLGLMLGDLGEYGRSMAVLYECVSIGTRTMAKDNLHVPRFWLNIGISAQTFGRPREALEAFERVIEIMRPIAVRREVFLLACAYAAEMHVLLGDERACFETIEVCLDELEQRPSIAPSTREGVLRSLVFSLLRTGRNDLAGELLAQYEEVVDGQRPEQAAVFRAFLLDQRGQSEEALAAWIEVRQLFEDLESSPPGWMIEICLQLGRMQLEAGNPEAASEALRKATAEYEAELNGRLSLGFGRSLVRSSPYRWLARVEFERGDPAAFWNALEADSSRVLADLLESDAAAPHEEALGKLEQRARELRAARDDDSVDVSSETLEAELKEVEARSLELLALRAGFGFGTRLEPETWRAIQAELGPDEAHVGWFDLAPLDGEGVIAWTLRSEGPPTVRLIRGEGPSFVDAISGYRRSLVSEASSTFKAPKADTKDGAASRLGNLLIGPILSELEGVRHLFVSTREIQGVPIEALRIDGGWIDERWTVSYAPSSHLHVALAARQPSTSEGALVIADPPFQRAHIDEGEVDAIPSREGSPSSDAAAAPLSRLEATRAEALAISAAIPGSQVLLGVDASESALRAIASEGRLDTVAILHFATHAIVDDRDASRSRLVLSQVDLPDPFESAMNGKDVIDGAITLREIVQFLELDADLVTLSACRSGLGVSAGGEGYIGLITGFLQAGARSVVASNWSVQDEPTQIFMQAFYGALAESEGPYRKAQALQQARKSLRDFEENGKRPYAHPAFWAAFTLTGAP